MINIAVAGFGFMGMTHTLNILKNDKINLVAVVDKDVNGITEKLSKGGGNFDTGTIDPKLFERVRKYADLENCLKNEQLDAVHICVHTDLHFELGAKVLSKGIHVLLEKPMTLQTDNGQALIELAKMNNCIFMVGHVLRFMYPYQVLKKLVDEQTYGKLNFLSMTRFSGVPAWGQWKEKQAAFGSSGGALFDLLIHDIDFVLDLLGKPYHIQSTCLPGALSPHDYISALWTYKDDDVKVKLEGGNTFHSNFPFQAGFMANFEKASVLYSTQKPEIIQVADNETIKEISADNGSDGYYNEIDYFADCVINKKQPNRCLPQSSLETIEICYKHIQK